MSRIERAELSGRAIFVIRSRWARISITRRAIRSTSASGIRLSQDGAQRRAVALSTLISTGMVDLVRLCAPGPERRVPASADRENGEEGKGGCVPGDTGWARDTE